MKEKLKKIIIPLLAVALLLLGFFFRKEEETQPRIEGNEESAGAEIIVEIKGEVRYPGVYQVSGDARVYELVRIAGGFTSAANTESVNLADFLKDGCSIYVAPRVEAQKGKISLNRASLEELMTLKGIGEVRAQSIIDYRELHGGFKTIDELKNVQGISENLFEQIKEFLTL